MIEADRDRIIVQILVHAMKQRKLGHPELGAVLEGVLREAGLVDEADSARGRFAAQTVDEALAMGASMFRGDPTRLSSLRDLRACECGGTLVPCPRCGFPVCANCGPALCMCPEASSGM